MKTRMVLDVGEWERYVIARYWGQAARLGSRDRTRPRATREQVRRFVQAAVREMAREQAAGLRGRQRATVLRLKGEAVQAVAEGLRRPDERQPTLTGM